MDPCTHDVARRQALMAEREGALSDRRDWSVFWFLVGVAVGTVGWGLYLR